MARRAAALWCAFGVITLVFAYTTVTNVIERPDGVKIAAVVHRHDRRDVADLAGPSLDRIARAGGDRRPDGGEIPARRSRTRPIRIIANRPDTGLPEEYAHKLREAQESHHLPPDARVLFVEVRPSDASAFSDV